MTHVVALLFYIGSLILWFRSLLAGGRGRSPMAAFALATAGVVAHFVALAQFTVAYGQLPLVGLAPSLSTLALVMGVGLLATLGLGEGRRIGIIIIPGVIVLQGVALSLGIRPVPAPLDFQGAWFTFHVTLAFLGLGGMAQASASGVLYLIQLNEIKSKRLGRLFHFTPPLATLDRLTRIGLVGGFTTFSLGLALGWVWTLSFRHSFQGTDPKVVWAVLSWFVFVVALAVRGGGGLKERRSAVASVVGFAVIVVVYVGLRVASTGVEGFFL